MNSTSAVNLIQCDQEPIHIPGLIQPHGVLLILDASLRVLQCSVNVNAQLGISAEQSLGKPISEVLGAPIASTIAGKASSNTVVDNPVFMGSFPLGNSRFDLLLHSRLGFIVVELEEFSRHGEMTTHESPLRLQTAIVQFQQQLPLSGLFSIAAQQIQMLTGFDRVLIYQFGKDWSGTVIGEARTERLPSYMDLRFPESDIPRQARELYRLNRVRLIADANYQAVPIVPAHNPVTQSQPDLTYAALRSVSPIHLEYMRNMGTLASLSVSIIRNQQLWGLIACHHHAPRQVPIETRFSCELLAQVLASQIAAASERASGEQRDQLLAAQQRLLHRMGDVEFFVDALIAYPDDMLECVGADGAAIVFENRCERIGRAPSEPQIREIVSFLSTRADRDVFATSELSCVLPGSEEYRESVSGLLAASISEYGAGYLLWFRPERASEVTWAGNPSKIEVARDGLIHPRKSFQAWTEREKGRARPWEESEVESARSFRSAIVNLVLRKAQTLASLSADLRRTNSELEAFSYSVSHDLRAPFRHVVGYAELLQEEETALSPSGRRYLATIIESAHFAGTLVDNLLNFAQIGRSKLNITSVPLKQVAEETIAQVSSEAPDRTISWKLGELPAVPGDLFLVRLVFLNLVRNAVKYTRGREVAVIEIGCLQEPGEQVVFVRDNGVGFDMQFVGKLFGVFQRLHRMEEFEGTGIGLANVRRIIGRHGGRTWAEGEVGKGATFYLSLPLHAATARD